MESHDERRTGNCIRQPQALTEALVNDIDSKVNMYSDVRREVKSLILAFAEQIQAQERERYIDVAHTMEQYEMRDWLIRQKHKAILEQD